jgi:hypothetical protein
MVGEMVTEGAQVRGMGTRAGTGTGTGTGTVVAVAILARAKAQNPMDQLAPVLEKKALKEELELPREEANKHRPTTIHLLMSTMRTD